jgi:hypothetical protein
VESAHGRTGQDESGWLEVLGASAPELERAIQGRVEAHLAAGRYTLKNIEYVAQLERPASGGNLAVSAASLERIRRLCQVWEVDFKPARSITSHRPILGPIIVAGKRLAFPIMRFFMRETLRQQRDFNVAVVEAIAELAKQIESRPESGQGAESKSKGTES